MTQFTDAQLETASQVIAAAVRENFPNVSVRTGTVMKELVVAASAIGFAVIDEKIEALRATQTLKYAEENPDQVDDTVIDGILSNYFLTRKVGTLATGILKITVATSANRTIPSGTEFITGNELSYLTESTFLVEQVPTSANSLTLQTEEGTGNFFFLLPVIAEEVGEQYSIAQDTQLDNVTLGADLILVTAFTSFSGGSNTETTGDLLERAKDAITVRDLTSRKAIRAVLPEEFPQIQNLAIMGYGDGEMRRDHGGSFGFGRGGRVDIYTRTSKDAVESVFTKTVAGDLTIDLDDVGVEVPFYKITGIAQKDFPDIPLVAGVDYTLARSVADDPQNDLLDSLIHARFTIYERAKLTFTNALLAGKDVEIKLIYPPDILAVQNFVLDTEERVVLADLLVKGITPCFVTFKFSYVKQSLTENVDLTALKNALKSYINTLAPGTVLAVSSLIDIIHNFNILRVETNSIVLEGELHRPDDTVQALSTDNTLDIPEVLSIGLSQRTVAYFVTLADIFPAEILV